MSAAVATSPLRFVGRCYGVLKTVMGGFLCL